MPFLNVMGENIPVDFQMGHNIRPELLYPKKRKTLRANRTRRLASPTRSHTRIATRTDTRGNTSYPPDRRTLRGWALASGGLQWPPTTVQGHYYGPFIGWATRVQVPWGPQPIGYTQTHPCMCPSPLAQCQLLWI